MTLPFPQFSGNLQQYGRNDSCDPVQLAADQLQPAPAQRPHAAGATTPCPSRWSSGASTIRTPTRYQQGPYILDRPQVLKLTAIWELPFGEGKKFGAGTHGFVKKLISGWEYTTFFNDAFSGLPGQPPRQRDHAEGSGEDTRRRLQRLRRLEGLSGSRVEPLRAATEREHRRDCADPASIGLGCGTDFSNNWGNYAWLQTTSFAPRYTPYRSGQIRVHHAYQLDASLLKTTKINERMRFQLGFEAFNLFNHNYFGRDNLNTDPTSANFGSVDPGDGIDAEHAAPPDPGPLQVQLVEKRAGKE